MITKSIKIDAVCACLSIYRKETFCKYQTLPNVGYIVQSVIQLHDHIATLVGLILADAAT